MATRSHPSIHQVKDLQTYEQLRSFLRSFVNASDTPDYDFVGALHLLLAITDNIAMHSTVDDFEALDEGDLMLTDAQVTVFENLVNRANESNSRALYHASFGTVS